jgi:hypothetical protein
VTGGSIRPGTTFRDDRGAVAQLHGVGVQLWEDRWYAWGEDKASGARFSAIACYSSGDLASWRYEGDALRADDLPVDAATVVERPKALRHPDGHWVLFLHLDSEDYSLARVGYAVADSPVGPYRFVGSERPLGNESRDIGVYQEDGVGYLLSEDRAHGLRIYRLRDDYLAVADVVATVTQDARPELGYESPTVVRHRGLYYLFGSDLTGWNLNDNKYCAAERLEGPWSPWRDFAPAGSRTHDSQVSVVVPVGAGFVYVGDRWYPDDLVNSPAVWLPLRLESGTAHVSWRDEWSIEELK